MNIKSWLSRARNIDREIDGLIEQRERERERILSITQKLSGDVVQTTKDPHRFDTLAEYDMEIDREIDNLVQTKTEIEKAISKLNDGRLREILRCRYLGNMTFEEISCRIKYSYKQTCRLHGRALIKLEGIVNVGSTL